MDVGMRCEPGGEILQMLHRAPSGPPSTHSSGSQTGRGDDDKRAHLRELSKFSNQFLLSGNCNHLCSIFFTVMQGKVKSVEELEGKNIVDEAFGPSTLRRDDLSAFNQLVKII